MEILRPFGFALQYAYIFSTENAERKTNHKFNFPLWFVLSPLGCSHSTTNPLLKVIVVHSLGSKRELLFGNNHFFFIRKFIVFALHLHFCFHCCCHSKVGIFLSVVGLHFRYIHCLLSFFLSVALKRDGERHTFCKQLYFLVRESVISLSTSLTLFRSISHSLWLFFVGRCIHGFSLQK